MKKVYWEIDGKSCKLRLKDRDNTKNYHSSLLKYKKFFWEKGIVHHEDVLAFSWEIVNSSDGILRVLRSKFPYFFVDEFQDTNPIQAEIIKLIGQKETVVGVVGDAAQSIYGFQGADVKQFNGFELPNMASYKIEDNHRSTEDIIKVLNLIRHDISQQSPSKKSGSKPIIIVDGIPETLLLLQNQLGKNKFTSLSYSNITANAVRNNLTIEEGSKGELIEEIFEDSDHKRSRIIISLIKAIEFARLHHYKDALSELNRLVRKSDESEGQRTSLIVLKTFLNNYDIYRNDNLWHFYEIIKAFKIGNDNVFPMSRIMESKNGKAPTNTEAFYKKAAYSRIALHVRIVEDNSLHRTIHKAKGDEFDNVLLFVKGRDGFKYNEERDLGFLLNPDITGNEEHRVYYVACSRARNRLYINVPTLSIDARNRLKGSSLFDGL
jgi:DNA helicase-2/ATP-dependent DNA helicase PcrA